MKIVSFNVNGVLNPVKRGKIFSKLKKARAEVVFLQETHLNDVEHLKLIKMGFKEVYFASYKSVRKRGVAILISKKLNYEHISEMRDKEGRFVLITGKIEGRLVSFLNVYAPPNSEWNFYREVFDLIVTKVQGILICGGDFNFRLNPGLDCSRNTMELKPLIKKVNGMLKEIGIVDVWRELNPKTRDYSHYSHPHMTYSRIDYFFTFKKDLHLVHHCELGTIDISDHSPIYMSMCLERKPRSTVWRMNSDILNNSQTKLNLENEIRSYLEINDNGEVSPSMLWDALKAVIRGKIIAITSHLKKLRRQKMQELEIKLKRLQAEHRATINHKVKQDIKKIVREIDDIYSKELQNKLIFLKQRYYETGGKSLKLLSYRLRKQQAERTINKIKNTQTGEIYCKLEQIQQTFETFYKALYSQPKINNDLQIDAFLASIDLPKVSEEQNRFLLAEITLEELKVAVTRLKTGKSPGANGYNAEWYKTMFDQLAPSLLKAFNWVVQKREILPSWREAIISVISKEGKDKSECGNYRPISVLNVDYKLFTSILARRLENILPDLINLDQTGFICKRQASDNIRRTLHVLRHVSNHKVEAALVSLDAEKAFDSVRWNFLYKVLTKFRFHNNFTEIIKTLYDKPCARIKINGDLSDPFQLERGTRQGCPISPLLFALFIEPLSQWIRQNHSIKGVEIESGEHKLALFADDILLYMSQPTKSLPTLFNFLKGYEAISGYKLNVSKTQVLTLNYDPPRQIKDKYNLKWDTKSINYLGVNISRDYSDLFHLNYGPLIKKIKSDLIRWNLIPIFSLSSRVDSVRMIILPKLLYLYQSLPVEIPNQQFLEWNKLISRFLWQGKKTQNKI